MPPLADPELELLGLPDDDPELELLELPDDELVVTPPLLPDDDPEPVPLELPDVEPELELPPVPDDDPEPVPPELPDDDPDVDPPAPPEDPFHPSPPLPLGPAPAHAAKAKQRAPSVKTRPNGGMPAKRCDMGGCLLILCGRCCVRRRSNACSCACVTAPAVLTGTWAMQPLPGCLLSLRACLSSATAPTTRI